MEMEQENNHDIGQAEEDTDNGFVIQFVETMGKIQKRREQKQCWWEIKLGIQFLRYHAALIHSF